MKLISMVDYVLQLNEGTGANYIFLSERNSRFINYANFLKQPLTLGMFVPCDLKGNVLEKQEEWSCKCEQQPNTPFCNVCQEQYYDAQQRVLFKGFEYCEEEGWECISYKNKTYRVDTFESMFKTVEKLLFFSDDIELTETAIKQIKN